MLNAPRLARMVANLAWSKLGAPLQFTSYSNIYKHYKDNFLAGYHETYNKIMEVQHYLEPKAMGQLAMINTNLKLNDTLRTKEILSPRKALNSH